MTALAQPRPAARGSQTVHAATDAHVAEAAAIVARFATTAPRYTSYPTAPHFRTEFDADAIRGAWATASGPVGLYVHVPFCDKRCLYCGCAVEIARDRALGAGYVNLLLQELDTLAQLTPLGADRPLEVVALGGGTPTWLAPADLRRLLDGIRARLGDGAGAEWSIEVDPRSIDVDEALALAELGFTRLSLGVQDLDAGVQKNIARQQDARHVAAIAEALQRGGGPSGGLNFDLMYGLPGQTEATMRQTVRDAVAMGPSRFAVFGYAHVPWMRKHQVGLERHGLPDDDARLRLMLAARDELAKAGYVPVGLDHYALADDPLTIAAQQGRLGRNFMGYTDRADVDLLAIGASAIGNVGGTYTANLRDRGPWSEAVRGGGPAWERAWLRSADDERRGWVIRQLLCDLAVDKAAWQTRYGSAFDAEFGAERQALQPFVDAGLVRDDADAIAVIGQGWLVARNVAAAFDRYLGEGAARYSRTV